MLNSVLLASLADRLADIPMAFVVGFAAAVVGGIVRYIRSNRAIHRAERKTAEAKREAQVAQERAREGARIPPQGVDQGLQVEGRETFPSLPPTPLMIISMQQEELLREFRAHQRRSAWLSPLQNFGWFSLGALASLFNDEIRALLGLG